MGGQPDAINPCKEEETRKTTIEAKKSFEKFYFQTFFNKFFLLANSPLINIEL